MTRIILRIAVIVLSSASSLMLLNELSSAQDLRNKETPVTNRPAEKTVDQVGKNIQVLNGMPQSQLYPAMRFMAASLGFQCGSCHVIKGGFGDFPADDKPEKQTARRMIKMVADINKTLGEGHPTVSCYTCHRGQRSPMSAPALPLQVASTISPSPVSTLPSVDEVLNRYVAAIGGKVACDRIKTLLVKGTTSIFSGQVVAYEAEQSAPDKGRETFAIETVAGGNCAGDSRCEYERVVNGQQGWLKSGAGVQELVGQQLGDQKLSFALFGILRLKDQYARLRLSGHEKIDDRDVYVVSGVRSDDKPERLYFDVESGLLKRRVSYIRSVIGTIPQQTDFEDYRKVEGLRLPFIIKMAFVDLGSAPITRTVSEMKMNVAVKDSNFEKPR